MKRSYLVILILLMTHGCWAHVRRKFYEARESSPRLAGWLLNQIQQLYRIEARLREQRAGPSLRTAVRASER